MQERYYNNATKRPFYGIMNRYQYLVEAFGVEDKMAQLKANRGVRTLSVRIPESLYHHTQRLAEHSNVSVNALVNQALARSIQEAQDKEMYEAATLLGMDAEETDVEFAFDAQAEVVLAHE